MTAQFKEVKTSISKNNPETKKNEFQGFYGYFLPILADVFAGFPAPDSWDSKEVEKEGEKATIETPVYKDEKLAFLQASLTQRVVGMARARINAGNEPANDWEAMLESGNAGEYQKQKQAFKVALAKWLKATKAEIFTEGQQASILSFCETGLLKMADAGRKEKVGALYMEFLGTLEDAAIYSSMINSIKKAISYEPVAADW